jgi:acetylornithine deacetylase/succinyl-diaminopimelate desuccinylase-like protein
MTTVQEWVQENSRALVDQLLDYVARPSVSAEGVGVVEVAHYAADLLSAAGLRARLVETPGWPAVIGHRAGPLGSRHVLVYGHYDVQPAGDEALWTSPPFRPEVREGRVWGRGAGDNKGQHLAHVAAVEALLATRGELPCSVTVLLDGEEEIGSENLDDLVRRLRDELSADVALCSDGPVHASGRSLVQFGARGVLQFELRARGAARDVHSGHFGEVAPNPLWSLVHLLATMKDPDGRVTIDGFTDAIQPLSPREREALDTLEISSEDVLADIGAARLAPGVANSVAERLMALPSFTINGLHGGYGGPGSKTVLPAEAFAKCDVRLVPRQDPDVVFGLVQEHVRRVAPDVDVYQLGGAMRPSRTPIESPLTPVVVAAVQSVTGEEPLLMPSMGGSLPTWVFTDTLGVPTFLLPLANADERNHAPDENMEVARFLQGIEISAAVLTALGAGR